MKCVERHLDKLFAFIAVFVLFGNMTVWANMSDFKGDKIVVSSFVDDNQDKPFLFNQITNGDASQIVSPQEHLGFGHMAFFSSNQFATFAGVSRLYSSRHFLQDKRELIFLYLFPFHFFW